LHPDERIRCIKGRVADYDARIKTAAVKALNGCSGQILDQILGAFEMRVEDHFVMPGRVFRGHALDYLLGEGIVSIQQYELLDIYAAGVAGTMMDDAGFPDFAKGAYDYIGLRVSQSGR
jgi:hypothetical protein